MTAPVPDSPFHPPRATTHGLAFRRGWHALRRRFPTSPVLHAHVDATKCGMAFLVPIVPLLGLHLASPPLVRRIGKLVFVVAALVAVVYFDGSVGAAALGLLAAVHGLGVGDYWQRLFPLDNPLARALRRAGITVACAVLLIVYTPGLFTPYVIRMGTTDGRILLVNPRDVLPPSERGALVAFYRGGINEGAYVTRAGRYLGVVLAVAGDRLEPHPDGLLVNGVLREAPFPRLSGAPLVIPPGHSLLWPHAATDSPLATRLGQLVTADRFILPDSTLVGRPYRRWFWRTQNIEP